VIRWLSIAALAALFGCAVGPDYHRPVPTPDQAAAFPYLPQAVASGGDGHDDWWGLYGDPALDRLVDRALGANTDLRAAEANFEAARAVLRQTEAARLPSTAASEGGSYGRTSTSTLIADSAGRRAENGWLFETGFDVAYEVDLFGRVRRSVEAGRADADAAAALRDGVRLTIVAETVRDYVAACAIGAQIDVARTAVATADQQEQVVERQAAAGGASDFDVARQRAVVAQTRAAIPALDGERRATLFALAAVLGGTPADVPTDAEACRALPEVAVPIPVGDGAGLIARRPDIRVAERRMAAASARIGVAKADLLPRITLLGSVSSVAPDLPDIGSHAATSFGLGPLINWSFPNIAAAQARIEQAKASDRAAIADYDGAVLTALKEVEQALARYSAARLREAQLDAAVLQAQTAFDLAGRRWSAGSISRLDLLVSELSLIDAKLALAAARTDRANILVSLFKALGGGWSAVPR
jgi:NodT family efflux transporter outer membrane factor (OMF) lipoprotein